MTYFVTGSPTVDERDMPILTVSDSFSAHPADVGGGEWIRVYLEFIARQCVNMGCDDYDFLNFRVLSAGVFSTISNLWVRKCVIEFSNKCYTWWCDEQVRTPSRQTIYDSVCEYFCGGCVDDCDGPSVEPCAAVLDAVDNRLRRAVVAPLTVLTFWWQQLVCPDLDAYYAANSNPVSINRLDRNYS